MTRPPPADPSELRVVMQYWKGNARVCELESAGETLDVRISPCDEAGQPEWMVEVRSGRTDTSASVTERGATRASALLAVGSSWLSRGPALGFRRWDFEAVARVLRTVQAID